MQYLIDQMSTLDLHVGKVNNLRTKSIYMYILRMLTRMIPHQLSHCLLQKSRLGALESLRIANSRSIVVASDVAARGLDIPSVTTVVHYDVARVVDTFIHRAGRTAVGEKHLRFFVLRSVYIVNVEVSIHGDEDASWTRVSDFIWG